MSNEWASPVLLSAMGALVLAVGLLVYSTDRNPTHATLFPAIAALHTGPVFGVLGAWLPSFVHPFAFSLFTAAALPRTSSPAYGACAAWWAVNLAVEAGQHALIHERLAVLLQSAFGSTRLPQALSNYFLRGRFDVGDVIAATAGALAAAATLRLVHRREVRHGR